MLVRVDSVDKMDNDSMSVDCSVMEFPGIETALHQIAHTTTGNEPLTMVQQVQGQMRYFEVWHPIVRSYDQKSTSDQTPAYAASNQQRQR